MTVAPTYATASVGKATLQKVLSVVGGRSSMADPPNRQACGGDLIYMFYVYVLKSLKDKNLYYGFTEDLKQRVKFHNLGINASTKHRRPLELIYYEAYIDEKDARKREIFLKSGRGREIIKKQLENSLMEKG